mmetsp:Transcript_17146/g.40295  ORF Transcript_17146/g.40295 Transcript_17146/m.40295 type:complete len:155 (+) Transcript_17146:46-510(+)
MSAPLQRSAELVVTAPRPGRTGGALPSLGSTEAAFSGIPSGSILANAAPGYSGHVPGKYSENVHGLSFRDANEHAVAEIHALGAGFRAEPPNYLWATSTGHFPGLVPSKRSGRHTLDKVTKPHHMHVGPRSSSEPRPREKPAGVKGIWPGTYSP